MASVIKISQPEDLQKAFKIRQEVFVEEQNVPYSEEFDLYDKKAHHFLAIDQYHCPCGTARWRVTPNGIKLERFAVLNSARGKGVGYQLLKTVMADINKSPLTQDKLIYLHAQLGVLSLYEKLGFQKTGTLFQECGIDHLKMVYKL